MVINWIVDKVIWLLFFYALCSDIYAIWKYYRLKDWDGKAVCIPFVPIFVYALWAYYFIATVFTFKILCFIHFWALVVMPGWYYFEHRNKDKKTTNGGGQSASVSVEPVANLAFNIENYFKGGYELNKLRVYSIAIVALLCVVDILYVGWPLHFFYAVEGRASDIRTGQPIRYAVIDDCWVSDTQWQPFGSAGSSIQGGVYWTDGNGDYHLPGLFIMFPFFVFKSRRITFSHPLYSDMSRIFTLDKVYFRSSSEPELTYRSGRIFKADIKAQNLADRFPPSGQPINFPIFEYEILPVWGYIQKVDMLGIGAKVDWPEILAVFRRIQGEGCSGAYDCMSSQEKNIRNIENYYQSVSR